MARFNSSMARAASPASGVVIKPPAHRLVTTNPSVQHAYGLRNAGFQQLVAPDADGADAVASHALDELRHSPLLQHGRLVQAEKAFVELGFGLHGLHAR